MTGFHGAHVTGGVILLSCILIRVALGALLGDQLRTGRAGRPVLALRRPGLDHPVHDRLPDLKRRRPLVRSTRGLTACPGGSRRWPRPSNGTHRSRRGTRRQEAHAPYLKVWLWLAVLTAIEYFYATIFKDLLRDPAPRPARPGGDQGGAGRLVLHAPEVRGQVGLHADRAGDHPGDDPRPGAGPRPGHEADR